MAHNSIRRLAASAVAAAALVPAVVVPVGAAQADEAQWRAGDDYVRVLVYWHHHPDWGMGG